MKPLLSICIPTYNRCNYLINSIESIIVQPEFIDQKVEIIISDNASTDETEIKCIEYTKKYKNIQYFRNSINIRDENFPLVLSKGNGILRKLSNDTLIYNKTALCDILGLIERFKDTKPMLFFRNDTNAHKSISVELNFQELLYEISYFITWIACFSIWDEDCENLSTDLKGCDLLLWQVQKMCSLVEKKQTVVINKEIFTVQSVNTKNVTYGIFKVFYINFFSILEPYLQNNLLTEECIEYIKRDLLFNFLSEYLLRWETGNKQYKLSNDENIKNLVFSEYRTRSYFWKFCIFYYYKLFIQTNKNLLKKMINYHCCSR